MRTGWTDDLEKNSRRIDELIEGRRQKKRAAGRRPAVRVRAGFKRANAVVKCSGFGGELPLGDLAIENEQPSPRG